MQLPNLGALSLDHAASAPVPDHELTISTYTADDVVDIDDDDSQPEEELDWAEAMNALGGPGPSSNPPPKHIRDLQNDLAALDKQATPKSAGKQPAAAKGGPSADAMRARLARQYAEEDEERDATSKRKGKQKSEAEKEAARLERNRKQRERNAAKSVEGVVENLITQVEAQNAKKEPEVIDLTNEEPKKKKKHKTWWMIREEDSRTPGERHASNEGTYDRLELRKGSKGLRFKPPK